MFGRTVCRAKSAPQAHAWFIAIGALTFLAPAARAAAPQVEFDAAPLASVADVTTAEFAAAHPGEKLIAARLELSSLVVRGDVADLVHVTYRVQATDDAIYVADYAPKTTLAATVAGNVSVERQTEEASRFHGALAARYFPFASANATLDATTQDHVQLRYELPPPQQLVAAAGTLDRGRGVYFKLRPARGASLEGSRRFVVAWRVPASWRAGRVRISAEARCAVGGVLADDGETALCGNATFDVGLYLAGDTIAQKSVAAFLAAESQLAAAEARIAAQRKKDLARHARHTWNELHGIVDAKKRADQARRAQDLARLPEQARQAVAARDQAAKAVAQLNAPILTRLPPVRD